jgi:hypothetical protein
MDKAARLKTAPSTASTPARGEDSQTKVVDTQAQDTLGLEPGEEKEDLSSDKDVNADLFDPESDLGGGQGKSLANLNANGEVTPTRLPADDLLGNPPFNKLLHGKDKRTPQDELIYRSYEDLKETVALAGGQTSYAIHQINLKLPAKFVANSVDLQANIALARQRLQHQYPHHKLLQIRAEKGMDWENVDHVQRFAGDYVRFNISPWLLYDCIDAKSHRAMEARLMLRSMTNGMTESDQDYMTWPPSEFFVRYTKF